MVGFVDLDVLFVCALLFVYIGVVLLCQFEKVLLNFVLTCSRTYLERIVELGVSSLASREETTDWVESQERTLEVVGKHCTGKYRLSNSFLRVCLKQSLEVRGGFTW